MPTNDPTRPAYIVGDPPYVLAPVESPVPVAVSPQEPGPGVTEAVAVTSDDAPDSPLPHPVAVPDPRHGVVHGVTLYPSAVPVPAPGATAAVVPRPDA